MYNYSQYSLNQLSSVHPKLKEVCYALLEIHDHRVQQGGRSESEQWSYFNSGNSKLHPPDGKHLTQPDGFCYAVDLKPFINGKAIATDAASFGPDQRAQFGYFLGMAFALGKQILKDTGYELRFGVNWDMDAEILSDQNFDDWFHIELVKTKV